MPKKQKSSYPDRNSLVLLVLCLLIVGLGIYFVSGKLNYYKSVARQAEMEPVRSLIINAVDSSKKLAPVDAQTGDYYFPEARLRLPLTETEISGPAYFYNGHDDGGQFEVLSITSTSIVNQQKARLYSADNQEGLFEIVPKLQACSRGVRVFYNQPVNDSSLLLADSIQVADGRTLYFYSEAECPELLEQGFVDRLNSLQSY